MRLYHEGITRITDNKIIIAELKKAGYVEVVEETPAPEPTPEPEQPTAPDKSATSKAVKHG